MFRVQTRTTDYTRVAIRYQDSCTQMIALNFEEESVVWRKSMFQRDKSQISTWKPQTLLNYHVKSWREYRRSFGTRTVACGFGYHDDAYRSRLVCWWRLR